MMNVNAIDKVLHDFKKGRQKNDQVVLGESPEMDVLFANFRESVRKNFGDQSDSPGAFSIVDGIKLAKDEKPKRVTISRSDVLMMLDDADPKGFKLFGKHKELPGQFGILFTKKGIVSLNHSNSMPGCEGGFVSWEGFQFCNYLLVDQRRGSSSIHDTDVYPGKFVFMCYGCGLESGELYENVTEKIEKLLGCNDNWVGVVKGWHGLKPSSTRKQEDQAETDSERIFEDS